MGRKKDIQTTLRMASDYSSGMSMAAVGRKYDVSKQVVAKRFRRALIVTRPIVRRASQIFNGVRYYLANNGYFYCRSKGIQRLMHRAVWEHYNGPITDSRHIHHIDSDRSNNKIENLELLDQSSHMKNHYSENISKDILHHNVKFNTISLGKFMDDIRDGQRTKDIAKKYGVSRQLVHRYKNKPPIWTMKINEK
jgi:Mor family transcriptional regulator